jgi:hypothetical protein
MYGEEEKKGTEKMENWGTKDIGRTLGWKREVVAAGIVGALEVSACLLEDSPLDLFLDTWHDRIYCLSF